MSREEGEAKDITIWNLSVPVGKKMKAEIRNMCMRYVREFIQDDEQIRKSLLNGVVKHRDFFVDFFKPIVEEAMEDIKFTVEVAE